jgi:hypothetical protein
MAALKRIGAAVFANATFGQGSIFCEHASPKAPADQGSSIFWSEDVRIDNLQLHCMLSAREVQRHA